MENMTAIKVFLLNILGLFIAISPMQSYVEGSITPPISLFPHQAVTQHEKTLSGLLFRGLFKYDIYGSLIPDLADTWELSDDKLSYTITLKDDQFWSDGKKITADDLLYSAYKHPDLSGVATDKVDDLTVRYTLPNEFAPFLSLLTAGVLYQNSEDRQNKLEPISSGDWRISRVERLGNSVKSIILYTNNNDYKIKKLVFKYYSNEDELVTAAKLGEIDGFVATKQHTINNFDEHRFPMQGIYYALYFDTKNEKLSDLEFREKLAKVINIDHLIYDKGIKVEGPISRSIYTDRTLTFDYYDDKFKEETLDEELTITVPDIQTHINMSEAIADFWEEKLNIDVKIRTVDPATIVQEVIETRDYEILLYGQEIGRDPDRYVNWHSTQNVNPGLNLSNYENVRADRALEEGRSETEYDSRVVHYNELQKTIVENVPAVFLYHPYARYYVSKYIDGVGEKYTFTQQDIFLDLSNWKRVKTI